MSVPLVTNHPSIAQPAVDRHGLLFVAGAASISLSATLFLILYVATLSLFSKHVSNCRWASSRLAFMQTSFGPLFLNLVFADMLQAIGLMHNFVTVRERVTATPSLTCTSQGVIVQLTDVASALLNLLIAVETFVILSNGPMLSWRTQFSTVGIWMLSCCFAFLGLLGFSGLEFHAFYTWSGAWCWISMEHASYQIAFHNVWIWLTAVGSTALYGILFWKIRTHYKGEGNILRRSSIVIPPPDSPSTISSLSVSQSNLSSSSKSQTVGKRGLQAVARTMLVYPLSFLAYSIPLSIVSMLEEKNGSSWRPMAMLVLSTIFALRGAIDVVIFGMTRNVFILRAPPPSLADDDSIYPSSPRSLQTEAHFSLDMDSWTSQKLSIEKANPSVNSHKTIGLQFPKKQELARLSVIKENP